MFEGAVAAILNRFLGKYVEDLDTEDFNVGIFSGDTCLTDLRLKPEALYQLGLPIRVELGLIGKISLKIPWTGLFSQPIILCVEDVYIVAVSEVFGSYDSEVHKRLLRAAKKKVLEDLEREAFLGPGFPSGIFDNFLSSLVKNFQITVNNVHVRYEEKFANKVQSACGICMQNLTMATTNNKWKPGVTPTNSTTIYQLIRVESFCIYMDPQAESSLRNDPSIWDFESLLDWKDTMRRSLQTFGLNDQEFQFLVKPFTTKIKIIISKANGTRDSRMLVDIVLQDVAMQVSKDQYITFLRLYDSLHRASVSRHYKKNHPNCTIQENSKSWWKYAHCIVLEQNVRPYTWTRIQAHRANYKRYKEVFIQNLLKPNDTELKMDLQKYEDTLSILNIVIAREHAKIELKNKNPDLVTVEAEESSVRLVVRNEIKAQDINQKNRKFLGFNCNDLDGKGKDEKVTKLLDHKYNFTLANYSLSLLNNEKEVLVLSMSQFLASIEKHPELSTYKISTRAESIVIEGVSSENELVPLVTADNVLTGSEAPNFLAIDFEKKPLNSNFNYDISVCLEPIEVTYHHYAVSEIINFFKISDVQVRQTTSSAYRMCSGMKKKIEKLLNRVLTRHLRIILKIDVKGPYIVFPQYGSLLKEGYVLLIDTGRMTLRTELQAPDTQLEDATLMELEELLYDRLHLIFTDGQVLLCHTGDDWRDIRRRKESENHLIPKLQASVTVSSSIKPEYRVLPRMKVNVSVSQLKFNLSENRLRSLVDFLDLLSIPSQEDIEAMKCDYLESVKQPKPDFTSTTDNLIRVRSVVALSSTVIAHNKSPCITRDLPNCAKLETEKSVISSEISEEDLEQLFRMTNVSGFDDIVSPQNRINLLLRFVIGELSFHFGYITSTGRQKPYLILKFCTLYFESAVMEYGFALQSGIGTILLADKTEAGVTGSYLELISTNGSYEVFSVSYRKVKANCPDFKSHFRNVERSLTINIMNLNIVFHRQAFMKLNSYCTNLYKTCYSENIQNIIDMVKRNAVLFIKTECDPPIPPGAIKLSYSIRLNTFILKLCSKDADFLIFKIMGVENDCIYNANERMMLRAHLTSLAIEDLGNITLYSKILMNEDEKVFDLKYVRHTPKLYKCSELDTKNEKVMSDGSFKLSIGRINCVFISKILSDCQHFLNPFVSFLGSRLAGYLRNFFFWSVTEFMKNEIKLQVSIDLQGPTFLLPQKKDYPNLLVFDIGTLTIENFLKKSELTKHGKINNESNICVLDNILIKLNSMTLSRAIMTLGGNLEIQEPIVEPMQIRFDIKRKIVDRKVVGRKMHEHCLCNIQGSIDTISMNLGQKDLTSVFSIWEDNLSKTFLARKMLGYDADSSGKKILKKEDEIVKKLEVFFSQNEHPVCEINLKVILDGLQLNLFSDTEEVLSSPVRDLNHGLCKLVFGEISSSLELFNNKSLTVKNSVRSCELEDMRKRADIIKKIIQSPAKRVGINSDSGVYISMPPALDFSFTRTSTGDTCLDMLVEESRVNLCVPFLLNLGQYFLDSIPGEQIDEGVINEGYEGNDHEDTSNAKQEHQTSIDPNLFAEEQSGSSISIRVRKPELLLFSDLNASNAHAILLQAELMIESSRHKGLSSIVCTLSDVRAKSKSQQRYLRQSPHWVLLPCDVEICRKEKIQDVQITAIVSSINLHLSVGTICTFIEIISEALNFFKRSDSELVSHTISRDFNSHTDLWSSKTVSHIPYKETEKVFSSHSIATSECDSQVRFFELKPVSIHVQLEMEETAERISIIKGDSEISGSISDWDSSNFQMQSSLKLYVYCYNINTKTWEPFIGLCPENNGHYIPWTLTFKMYQDEAYSLSSWLNYSQQPMRKIVPKKRKREMDSSEDETNEDMIFIPPNHVTPSKITEINYNFECDDSDSDNNSESEKLAKTFSRLFNKDTSDEEGSDSDESSKYEDEGLELTPECLAEPRNTIIETPMKRNARATYFIISAKDKVDVTISPNTISLMEMIYSTYSKTKCDIPTVVTKSGKLNLQNNIGHASTIEFLIKEEGSSENQARLIAAKSFHEASSPASIPSSPENEPLSKITSPSSIVNIDCELSDQNGISQDSALQMFPPFTDETLVNIYKKITSERLRIMVEGFEDVQIYCPRRRGCNQVALHPIKNGIRYHLIVETIIDTQLHRTISVHSPLQIRNETSYAIGLHYKKQLAEKLQLAHTGQALNPFDDNMRMTIIEPDEIYNVPLFIAYHFPIYLLPAYLEKYEVSEEGLCWRELSDDLYVPKDVYCKAKESDSPMAFGVKVICSKRQTTSQTNSQVPEYLIRMLPPLIFENKLPFVIDVSIPCVDYEMRIEPGERISVYCIKCNSAIQIIFKIQNYLGTQWSGTFQLTSNLDKKFVKMFSDSELEFSKPFLLCVELNRLTNWIVDIYAQYWIVNKTGLPLSIRESHTNVMYEIPENELVVFSQKEKRKKRVIKLKAQQSGWSPSFNLDGISSMSLILCRDIERRRKYRILSESSISHLAPIFTKIVTFLPYFFCSNKTKKALRFMEENEDADLWNDLLPGQGMAFWPYTESMKMRVKWKNSQLVSQHFDMTAIGKTILRMDNGTALSVHIDGGSSSPFNITFQKFQDGDAPVRVDNLCNDLFLKINQINLGQATLLNPLQCLLYTWDDPSKERILIWNVYNSKTKGFMAQFSKDGYGEETVLFRTLKRSSTSLSKKLVLEEKTSVLGGSSNEDTDSDAEMEILKLDQVQNSKATVFWVSYTEGEQRVLMFTQDESIFRKVRSVVDPEISEKEVFCAISGIGLSLVANSTEDCRELAYASIMDSAAHWEVFVGQKWKSLTLELSAWVENKYTNGAKKAQFENFIDIDLSKMYMTKPFFGKLRRTYSPGIWIHYRNSATFTYLQGYLHKMQIDNQLQEVSFPVMLHTSLQKSLTRVMENRKLKHFVEFCCLKQFKATRNVFKEISLIVREFSLNLQEDFLMCLINNLFPKRLETKHSIAARLRKDLSTIHVTAFCNKEKIFDNQKSDIIDHLYISPITIHLKLLANTKGFNANQTSEQSEYCNFVRCMYDYACRGAFEKSAEFRLPAYETDCLKISSKQCFSNIWHYYTGKILQQFNVLILSVTILGNPYGYNFKSIDEENSYESNSILICEDEFAEKLSYDISCLLGYSTLDTMQTSHFTFQDAESNTPSTKAANSYVENKDEPLSVLLINNSFSVDMELQLSGLIIKPTDNTHQEELRCFFKTIGKCLLRLTKKEGSAFQIYRGLITDSIKRAQEMGYKFVARARLPRYIDPYSGVELYSYHKAKGLHLLNVINKNCYSHKDSYWTHTALSSDGKHVALVSLRRIFLIEHRSVGDPWIVEWSIEINQLSEPPVLTGNKIVLRINKDEKLSSVVDSYLESKEIAVLEWLCRKINIAMILNMESSTCPRDDA